MGEKEKAEKGPGSAEGAGGPVGGDRPEWQKEASFLPWALWRKTVPGGQRASMAVPGSATIGRGLGRGLVAGARGAGGEGGPWEASRAEVRTRGAFTRREGGDVV